MKHKKIQLEYVVLINLGFQNDIYSAENYGFQNDLIINLIIFILDSMELPHSHSVPALCLFLFSQTPQY